MKRSQPTSKLDSTTEAAFTLDDMILTDGGVQIDYQNYEGKSVRIHFRFTPSGKIAHTSCEPLACTA